MTIEKKTVVGKKAASATKNNATKSKVDTEKPATSRVVAAKGGGGYHSG